MRTRCLEAPGRDRFGMAGARMCLAKGGESRWLTFLAAHARWERRKMTLRLAQVIAAWPFGASLAAAVLAQSLYAGRRRSALNEAVHELRRPLQALALVAPALPRQEAIHGSVEMAANALERLEREINGEGPAPARTLLPVQPLLESAVSRWRARAALAGGSLTLGSPTQEGAVEGDREELAQAIDNLIVNAIEHGGPEIILMARADCGRLHLTVLDFGTESRPKTRHESPAELIARLSGRRRRGHGLRVVRRTAAAHGGRFLLSSCGQRTEAVLDLPLTRRPG